MNTVHTITCRIQSKLQYTGIKSLRFIPAVLIGIIFFSTNTKIAAGKDSACATPAKKHFNTLWEIKAEPQYYGRQKISLFDTEAIGKDELVYVYRSFKGFQMFSLFLAQDCSVRSAKAHFLTIFERTARDREVSLVVFWSPHCGIDNTNFDELIRLQKKYQSKHSFQVLLIADPLANKEVVESKLKSAGLRSIADTQNELSAQFQDDSPADNKIRTFDGGETSLLEEIPLCQFPITLIWKNDGNLKLTDEWVGEFPTSQIEKKLTKILNQ